MYQNKLTNKQTNKRKSKLFLLIAHATVCGHTSNIVAGLSNPKDLSINYLLNYTNYNSLFKRGFQR